MDFKSLVSNIGVIAIGISNKKISFINFCDDHFIK